VLTILVADDNSNIQKMVTLAFKGQGIDVIAVGNGEAAVRKLPDALPDLVLADVFMPVRNGYEVCEFVKRDARFAHIPVVLLVGAFDPLDEHEAQRVGADGVLKKPFVPPEPLINMVKSLLAKSGGARLEPVAAAVRPAPEKTAAVSKIISPEPEERPLTVTPAEPALEDFFLGPARIEFGKDEAPLAFGELLGAPPAEVEDKEGSVAAHEAGLGDVSLWQSAAATEGPATEQETPAWRRPESEESTLAAEPEAIPEEEPSAFSSLAAEPAPTEKAGAPPAGMGSTPSLGEFIASRGFGRESQDAGLSAPAEPETGGVAKPAAEVPQSVAAPEPTAPLRSDAVQSFSIPQPPDPQLVETIVARVIERLRPQIVNVVTREILKPMVDALVRRELEKL